jgi:asparagine synthase (glutamine-hydrolysing)
MCGIVGLYQWPQETGAIGPRLSVMGRTIFHRGPDDDGAFVDGEVGLSMRRLSIIDVAGGHQPIQNEDGSITVVFNGEIYNYQALRNDLQAKGHLFRTRTDTETIVHAYEEYGTDCVKRFNGIFAFALWDARAQRLFLARDRIGVKPLYYVQRGEGLAFASEIKALLTVNGVSRTADLTAVAQFFRLGFVPPPLTLFRGIHKVPPGWRLIAENGQIRLEQYWDLEFAERNSVGSFAECCEQLRTLLQEAVVDQMVSDVPLGAFLSGGVDSSAVVAFMRQAATNGVRTYSIGFDREHAYHNETPFAEAVAKQLGTQHETLIVRPQVADLMPTLIEKLDEPLTDTSFLVTYLVSQLAHQEVKVALSGVGGDELFGGYRRYWAPSLHKAVAWMSQSWRQTIGQEISRRLRADRGTILGNFGRYAKALGRTMHLSPGEQYLDLISVLSVEHVTTLLNHYRTAIDPVNEVTTLFDKVAAPTSLDRLLYVDLKTVLPESLLLLTDKMGMATSLEVRVPFLDNRIVDFVSRVPSEYRLRGLTLKRLLKATLKGVVPDFVLTRSKRGFGTPMGSWLRTDLRPMVVELLEEGRLRRDGLFNVDFVRYMLSAHDVGREDFTEPIVALLTFELWREQFRVALS